MKPQTINLYIYIKGKKISETNTGDVHSDVLIPSVSGRVNQVITPLQLYYYMKDMLDYDITWLINDKFDDLDVDVDLSNYVTQEELESKGYQTEEQCTEAVATAVANLVNSAPETLDTLNEIAEALGNDPNFATTITTILGQKLDTSTYETDKDTFALKTDVPTKTSDLSNDSGYITSTDAAETYQPIGNYVTTSITNGLNVVEITLTDYDALESKDNNTLYIISSGATYTITITSNVSDSNIVINGVSLNSITVTSGEEVSYFVGAMGYVSQSATFTATEDTSIEVTLDKISATLGVILYDGTEYDYDTAMSMDNLTSENVAGITIKNSNFNAILGLNEWLNYFANGNQSLGDDKANILRTAYASVASTDFNGVSNTDILCTHCYGNQDWVYNWCRQQSITINGNTKYGYLMAAGEMNVIFRGENVLTYINNLLAHVGGTEISLTQSYFASTINRYTDTPNVVEEENADSGAYILNTWYTNKTSVTWLDGCNVQNYFYCRVLFEYD